MVKRMMMILVTVLMIAVLIGGPYIYDVRTEGVRLRWTHADVGGGQLHVDIHSEN